MTPLVDPKMNKDHTPDHLNKNTQDQSDYTELRPEPLVIQTPDQTSYKYSPQIRPPN